MTMVERVARRLCRRFHLAGYGGEISDAIARYIEVSVEHDWHKWADDARVAIEAIREPTEAMMDVGGEARWRSPIRDPDNVREIWRAMIDASLSEAAKC